MCSGCGVCEYICKEGKVKLFDLINDGIRPLVEAPDCNGCDDCVRACPGHEIKKTGKRHENAFKGLYSSWGQVIEIWEGYSTDREIRNSSSSGGLATSLALYCLEREGMGGVLHTGADPAKAWKNKTAMSRNRGELLSRTGSRYSPASPCDGLYEIEAAQKPCVFIGKPCDVTGVRKAQRLRPALDSKLGLAISIFCTGTPSTKGTLELLRHFDIDLAEIKEIKYRGKGWPGMATVRLKKDRTPVYKMTYADSWGFLQRFRPLRCHLCPDGTGELADISFGDPWHKKLNGDDDGYSLAIVRTELGRKLLHSAKDAGYIVLRRGGKDSLIESQRNLLLNRMGMWGKLLGMRLLLAPTPKFRGFSLFSNWLGLPLRDMASTVIAASKKALEKKYFKKQNFLRLLDKKNSGN